MLLVVPALAVDFASEPLEIHRQDGKVLKFTAELALTEEQRRFGLMEREQMPGDHGMLFDFGESRAVYMWMKNTYLPLDMLFIDASGRVTHISADALPLSEEIISSRGNVRFVLELNGGAAAKLGIAEGDRVESTQVKKAHAK